MITLAKARNHTLKLKVALRFSIPPKGWVGLVKVNDSKQPDPHRISCCGGLVCFLLVLRSDQSFIQH
ncbi:MAG: hypothetical protein DWI07_01950 [Planctomycetota bacterium]|nr:MAG: hypothetical protein DWI07_01950 [Planctomycetota bacterium]